MNEKVRNIDDKIRNYLAFPFALLSIFLMMIAKVISPEHVDAEFNINKKETNEQQS